MNKIKGLKVSHTLEHGLKFEPVELDQDPILNQLYEHINCELVDCVQEIFPGIDLWIDDEGLLKEPDFVLDIAGRPIAGTALFLGFTNQGEATSLPLDAEKLAEVLEATGNVRVRESSEFEEVMA